MRDDRVFPETRLLGAVIVPFLVVAFALPGVTALMMGLDRRWSAIRITLESQLIGLALILLGTIRAWEGVDTSNALAFVFVAGITGLFISLLALELFMLGRERARPPHRARWSRYPGVV
jgi:hypothetical protein